MEEESKPGGHDERPPICPACGVTQGMVTGTARPVHVGRKTQVWDIRIEDERGKLCCVSRLTLAVIDPV